MRGTALLGAMAMLAAAMAAPRAQPAAEKTYRLGMLALTAESIEANNSVTLPELARLGFSVDRNLVVDSRMGPAERLPALARELLALNPDAIIAVAGEPIRAAGAATSTIPIVGFGGVPIALGLASSLARPGGNVTGVVIFSGELDAKRLDLLRQAVPGARRIAALLRTGGPSREASEAAMRTLADAGGFELLLFEASGPRDYPGAFAAMRAAGAESLAIGAHAEFFRDTGALAARALEARLPTVCEWAEMAKAGCLLGYGPDRADLRRRVAGYVARIFRGASPAEMPIEQPSVFEFAINLKTAKSLGVTIPPDLLARADEVIE